MKDTDTEAIAQALEKLTERLDGAVAGGRRSRRNDDADEAPRGVGGLRRGGDSSTTEVQAVLFQVRVPVGRAGETMPCFLQFVGVRDERELQDLAEDVRREFPDATIYQPKREYGSGYGRGNGYSRGGFDRGGRY